MIRKKRATDHVGGQFVVGQVLDVLVRLVDDLGQLLAVDELLEDPHGDGLVVAVGEARHIFADDLGNGRAPVFGHKQQQKKKDKKKASIARPRTKISRPLHVLPGPPPGLMLVNT